MLKKHQSSFDFKNNSEPKPHKEVSYFEKAGVKANNTVKSINCKTIQKSKEKDTKVYRKIVSRISHLID